MTAGLLYDIIESPGHPDLVGLCEKLRYQRLSFTNQRKAIAELKRRPPAVVVADFFYGYGNNYAGANVCNLDVLLRSLQRFAPEARVIVFADRTEFAHTSKLSDLFQLHAIFALPVAQADLEQALSRP